MWIKGLFATVAFGLCQLAAAQTRWCSITGKAKTDTIFYPPIARAAHITGTVIGRLQFSPDGKVKNFEVVSGPVMLTTAVTNQVKSWALRTDAEGEEPCQSLFIVDFRIGDSDIDQKPVQANRASMFQVSVRAQPLILYSLPSVAAVR